jgi:hypothetical protein
MTSVYDCSLITFPRIGSSTGALTPVYQWEHIPFGIARVFYLYDIPGGADRGAHAHRQCHQVLVSAMGSFDVSLDDGVCKRTVSLNRPYFALHIPPLVWAQEFNFSAGGICLVLASHPYDAGDYIRDYDEFLRLVERRPA